MANGNNVQITGNCTRDPELRFTPGGTPVAEFGVAVNRRWQNKTTNEWEEAVSFFDVTCWEQLAENVSASVGKGTRVVVEGRLDQQSWDDKTTGEKRSKVVIVADEVAPSLKYATATVVKNERRDGGNGAHGNGAASRSSNGRGSAPQEAPAYDMSEPF